MLRRVARSFNYNHEASCASAHAKPVTDCKCDPIRFLGSKTSDLVTL